MRSASAFRAWQGPSVLAVPSCGDMAWLCALTRVSSFGLTSLLLALVLLCRSCPSHLLWPVDRGGAPVLQPGAGRAVQCPR